MRRLFTCFVTLMLCVTAMMFQSCSDDKYTVWTETEAYSLFTSQFNMTLDDGNYAKIEITSEQWQQIAPSLPDNEKHRWSEAEIKKWLIGNGFGEYESTKESSWLVMTNHAFLVAREGSFVHMILK